jgi:hypothetical protein
MTTFDRIIAHLADTSLYHYAFVRKAFKTSNGIAISIQQSEAHNSDSSSVELGFVPDSPIIAQYEDHGVYNYVPLEVLEKYIDWLESLPPEEVKILQESITV